MLFFLGNQNSISVSNTSDINQVTACGPSHPTEPTNFVYLKTKSWGAPCTHTPNPR